jgi:hypothetical protein
MLTLLVAARLIQTGPSQTGHMAADFFPLVQGTVRTFVETGGQVTTEEVMPAITVGGKPAIPVVQRHDNRVSGTTYYRVDENIVYLLGNNSPSSFLASPMPLIEFDGHAAKWTYAGAMEGTSGQPFSMSGECRGVRTEEVLGKRVPVLEVELRAVVPHGRTEELDVQVAKYALGIGLCELKSSVRGGKYRTAPIVRKLTNIEGAKSDG